MLPLQRIREDPEAVREGARRKGETAPVDEILRLDAEARRIRAAVEMARAEQKRSSAEIRGAPSDDQRTQLGALSHPGGGARACGAGRSHRSAAARSAQRAP